ncbi:MAG: hypothetical protein MJ180_05045 [Candidatus Gastranaerophilales bacterium]|nr:hypothetical protein [Candidatus Gastranaerophilales bacterium]
MIPQINIVKPIESIERQAHKKWVTHYNQMCSRVYKPENNTCDYFQEYVEPFDDLFYGKLDLQLAKDEFSKGEILKGIKIIKELQTYCHNDSALVNAITDTIQESSKNIIAFENKFADLAKKALKKGKFLKGKAILDRMYKMVEDIDEEAKKYYDRQYADIGLEKVKELLSQGQQDKGIKILNEIRSKLHPERKKVKQIVEKFNLVKEKGQYKLAADT